MNGASVNLHGLHMKLFANPREDCDYKIDVSDDAQTARATFAETFAELVQEAGEDLLDRCNEILGQNKVSGPSYYGRALAAICLKHPDLVEKNNGKVDKKRKCGKSSERRWIIIPFAQLCQASRRADADAACAACFGHGRKRSRAQAASEDRRESLETAGGPASIQISFVPSEEMFDARLFRTFYTTGRLEGLMAREIAYFAKDLRVSLHEETAEDCEVRLTEEHEATQREAVYCEKEKERKARLRAGRRVVEEPEDLKGDAKGIKRKRLQRGLATLSGALSLRMLKDAPKTKSAPTAEAFGKMLWKPSKKCKTRPQEEVAEEKVVKNDTAQRSVCVDPPAGQEDKGKTTAKARKT